MDNTAEIEQKNECLVTNRYSLVVLAAKRARQIKEGAPLLIDTESTNPLTVALEEIAAGKINFIEAPPEHDEEAARTLDRSNYMPTEPTAMQLLTESLAQGGSSLDVEGFSIDDEAPDTDDLTESDSGEDLPATEEE